MKDIVILGAGCAGLSLAYHLVERGVDRSIVLLDPRTSYERDRTWCFFTGRPHPFEALASHRWARWRVRDGRWIERSAPSITYQHLPADAFYQRCLARLEGRAELRLGVQAGALRERRGGVEIETSAGPIEARVVFDSRPMSRRAGAGEVTLLQHFEGWHVRVERPAFDPLVATLMDFAVPQDHAIHFVYVLPYSPTEALVEATWFGGAVLDDGGYRQAIERYLRTELRLDRWAIVRRERGVIPMSTADTPIRVSERIYRIGLPGGMAKPSTGYAFQAIQRFSAELAERLAGDMLPEPPAPRDWRARSLDAIFLSYLSRYPERAPATFATLFEKVDPALLVRFLSDDASPADCLRVMSALPLAPFTLETFRATRLWLR